MSWNRYPELGSSPPDEFSSFPGTGPSADALSALQRLHILTNPAGGFSETASYDTIPAMTHINLMSGGEAAGMAPELDASASVLSYHPRRDPTYPATAPSHTFGEHFGASYEPGSMLPTSMTHPLNMPSNESAFAPQPPPQSGNSAAWPNTMTPYRTYPVPTDLSSIGRPGDMHHLSSVSPHGASIASGPRTTPYPAPSPVLSTVPDYTLEEGFKFHVITRGLSPEPTELKEWKPENCWDYTVYMEGIKTQMGANIKINLNNPREIPTGSLGLWFYMRKEGSDDLIEAPTCGNCEKRQLTNVSRFKDAITTEQAHTRIICSPSTTWLQPLPDNSAYSADVTFLIWCPAYHDVKTNFHNHTRVKPARQHFQLVCVLRDHMGRTLANTTLRRTWGGDKPSRRIKKDANGRSGHRVNISGELTTPHIHNRVLPSSRAPPSLRSDKPCSDKPRSDIPPIKVEASSPTPATPSRVDLLSSPRADAGSKSRVGAPASGTRTKAGRPAAPPPIYSPEVTVLEEVDTPEQSDDVVELPIPAKPPVAIYVGSTSPQSRRSPAPSPESQGQSVSRSALGPRIIAPPLSESIMETVPPRPDFFGVWREEGRAGDEVRLVGAGFNRETEYFAKFGAVRPIQAFYQASNTLTCIVPWSDTIGVVAVSIVSRDESMFLCEQQQKFQYLSNKGFAALQRIMAALDSADEDDIQEEAADFVRRLSSKKQERRSREEASGVNPGQQHHHYRATAIVNSPVPVDPDPLLSFQPLPDEDDETLPPSRSSTLVTPSTYAYPFKEIKSLGEDPSSWDRVRSWFERKDPTTVKGRKRSAEEMEDGKGLETSRVPESPTLVESLAARRAGSPRVRAQEAHKPSCETQPHSKRRRLNVAGRCCNVAVSPFQPL